MDKNSILQDSRIVRNTKTGRMSRIQGTFELAVADKAAAKGAAKAEDTVKNFLVANADALELGMKADDLKKVQDIETPLGRIVRFEQTEGGIRILDTEIQVHLDQESRIRQIDLAHVPPGRISQLDGDEKMLTPAQAVKNASTSLGTFTERQKTATPEKVYFQTPAGLRLAFNVLILTDSPAHDWRLIVDAHSGNILSKQDLIWSVDGQGKVFDPNPVVTASNNTYRDPSATVATCGFAGTPQATIDAQQVTRTLKDITFAGGKYKLDGPFVKLREFSAPTIAPPEEAGANNFNYASSSDNFEPVMVYYHVDSFQRFIQNILGITTANNRKTEADAHDNGSGGGGYYSPGDLGLHFGDSGTCKPDRAEDADCILHEYNHAIMDNVRPGYGPWGVPNTVTGRHESRALGEGYGDVIPCIYFAPDHPYQREVFEDWVFVPGGLRRVDGTKIYPWNVPSGTGGDWVDEEHADGEIWSAALWNIYTSIGGNSASVATQRAARDQMLKTIISSYFSLTTNPNMMDAAEIFMQVNADLRDFRLTHAIEILNAFHDRGILHCSAGSNLRITDLWSQQNEIPVVGYQKIEYGQDNWFYATVKNEGTITARAAVVTFSFQCPYTTPVYPADMRNHIISSALIVNLAPGATETVRARFPKELIPAIPTGATTLHGCILAEVYNPVDHVAPGVTSVEWHKLYQRNSDVIDVLPNDTLDYQLAIGNFNVQQKQKIQVNVIRPEGKANAEVWFSHHDPRVISALFEKAAVIEKEAVMPATRETVVAKTIHFIEPGRIMMAAAGDEPGVVLNLARGSTLAVHTAETAGELQRAMVSANIFQRQAELVQKKEGPVLSLPAGKVAAFAYTMNPRERMILDVHFRIPADAKPGEKLTFRVEQKDEKGNVIGGFDVLANVVRKK